MPSKISLGGRQATSCCAAYSLPAWIACSQLCRYPNSFTNRALFACPPSCQANLSKFQNPCRYSSSNFLLWRAFSHHVKATVSWHHAFLETKALLTRPSCCFSWRMCWEMLSRMWQKLWKRWHFTRFDQPILCDRGSPGKHLLYLCSSLTEVHDIKLKATGSIQETRK